MKVKTIRKFILLNTIFTCCLSAEAQTFLGLQQSNYSGIHQVNLNPAYMADSRHRLYVNGFTGGFGFSNDYLKLNFPFPVMNLVTGNVPDQYKNSEGKLAFDQNWLSENVNGKSKNMNLYMQTRVPGLMIALPKGFALGLQYKNTISFQVNDFAEPLARLARYGIDSSKGSVSYSGPNQFKVGETFGDNSFTININAYGEIGLSIAKSVKIDDNLSIKAGITPKYLMGYATGYIKNRGIQVKAAGTDTVAFGETDVEYGYTDPSFFNDLNTFNVNAFTSKLQGSGFGYDIGAAFEYKADSKDKSYLFRGGVSILDGGHITYKSRMKNTHITNTGGEKYLILTPEFAEAWKDKEAGMQYTDSTLRTIFNVDTSAKSIDSRMPTTLNLQFDYHLFKIFYLGANLSQDLRGKKAIGSRKSSYLVVIPRIEHRLGELSFPLGMMNDYRTPRLGAFLRIGPAFIGTDNLIGQLRSKNIYGFDLYFGISTGITRNKSKKDKEKTDSYGML
jgi:hypothetical protein